MSIEIVNHLEVKEPETKYKVKPEAKPDFIPEQSTKVNDVHQLLKDAVTKGASDLHIKTPIAPIYRINGELCKKDGFAITAQFVVEFFDQITTKSQKTEFAANNELDFTYSV